MTIQIPDIFIYNGGEYEILKMHGKELIAPSHFGMHPKMLHTACYRGFYCTYQINNDGLFLTKMVIGEVQEGYKPIQGIMPKLVPGDWFGYPIYEGLRIITPFTGKITLGKDFNHEMCLNDAGLFSILLHENPIYYGTVLDFTFDRGKLVSIQDLSDKNAAT